MIYKYKWLDKFMKRFFLKAYFKRYFKLYPEAYQRNGETYAINITSILGHNTKHKDNKTKMVLDQLVSNGDFSNNSAGWNNETFLNYTYSDNALLEGYFYKAKNSPSLQYLYSPLYDTTLDKLTDEQIKEQLKIWLHIKEATL